METKPILEIHKLSKKFAINVQTSPYLTFRDSLLNMLKFKKTLKSQDFWALKEISFEVQSGETIGIIGKNGAGKSTLLKILNGDYQPDRGKYLINGVEKQFNSPQEAIEAVSYTHLTLPTIYSV